MCCSACPAALGPSAIPPSGPSTRASVGQLPWSPLGMWSPCPFVDRRRMYNIYIYIYKIYVFNLNWIYLCYIFVEYIYMNKVSWLFTYLADLETPLLEQFLPSPLIQTTTFSIRRRRPPIAVLRAHPAHRCCAFLAAHRPPLRRQNSALSRNCVMIVFIHL